MFDSELEHLIQRHGSPKLSISLDLILMRVIVEGETSAELQKDLAAYYRKVKPGYTVMFDHDLNAEIRTKRKAVECLRRSLCS